MKRGSSMTPARPGRREKPLVIVLCVLAALRVFFFSAAFPFFNNVDEQFHFDLVHKCARGHVPAGIEHLDSGAPVSIGALLIAVVALMTVSEIELSYPALHSAYNWFHLFQAVGS